MVWCVCVVVFGVVGLVMLLLFMLMMLIKVFGVFCGGGVVGFILGSFAMAMAYVFYVASACLFSCVIVCVWMNMFDDVLIVEMSEEDKNKMFE